MAGRQTFGAYVKAALLNRWNVLALFATGALAFMSGHPDVVLPIVAAAELAFVGMVATNPRFHRAVDAERGAEEARKAQWAMRMRFEQLYRGLEGRYRARFDELRGRCEVLRELAGKDGDAAQMGLGQVAQTQLSGVNKLLWVYLKLLHTEMTLERFFQSMDPAELDRLETDARQRLEDLPKDATDALTEKKRKSIEDMLATVQARRDNLKKAKENYEFVDLELNRIGAKLTGIAELAVNRQDPGLLTHDVDDVARSVQATEEAIGDLQVYTGLTVDDVHAPEILSAAPQRVRG